MITLSTKAFATTIQGISDAVTAAGIRAVNAQALNAKDQVIAALAKAVERPRPFTLNPDGYQADKPQLIYGARSARFYIKPLCQAPPTRCSLAPITGVVQQLQQCSSEPAGRERAAWDNLLS